MEKQIYQIPTGKRFLTQEDTVGGFEFMLPNGILSKQITGCGATTLALYDNRFDSIILCPRI